MPIKYKPIFICEGCGNELEDPNQIRIFNGTITDGNEKKLYSSGKNMFCLNCIPLVLDFKNENPSTIQEYNKTKFNEDDIEDIESPNNIIESLQNEISDIADKIKNHEETILVLFENISHISQDIQFVIDKLKPLDIYGKIKKDILPTDMKSIQDLLIKLDKFKEETSSEPETSLEQDIYLEAKTSLESNNVSSLGFNIESLYDDSGEYSVLYRIISDNDLLENVLALCKCKNTNDLQKILGNHKLEDLFYPVNKYINKDDYNSIYITGVFGPLKIINNFLFSIPNIEIIEGLMIDNYAFSKIK